jgi:predicted RNA-binding Zn-ribbon protein involved in translation (DUF1610 family)
MIVIKRGILADEKRVRFRCKVCGSFLEAQRKELKIVRGLPAQAGLLEFECPVCEHDSRLTVDDLQEVSDE